MSTRKKIEEKKTRLLLWEKRLLLTAFGCGVLASVLFLVSYSSEFWVFVVLRHPQQRNDTRGEFLKTGHYHGLWKICRQELWYKSDRKLANETEPTLFCRAMYFTLPSTVKPELRVVEKQMLDFRRSTVAMGIVSLLLSIVAHAFTWYSLGQLRYMFKRLAACIHIITGASCWVTLEVFRQSIMYEELNMKDNVPEFSKIYNGWSYVLLWFCLVMHLFPGVVLFACSRKRKGRKARSVKEAKENEPVHLGRI